MILLAEPRSSISETRPDVYKGEQPSSSRDWLYVYSSFRPSVVNQNHYNPNTQTEEESYQKNPTISQNTA